MDSKALLLILLLPLTASAGIHQWRDAEGRLHFGDKPPSTVESRVVEQRDTDRSRSLRLNLAHQGFRLPEATEQRVRRGLQEILKLYRQNLGLDVNRPVAVNLHLFDTHEAFARWFGKRAGGDPSGYAGVYLVKTREVGVWRHGDMDEVAQTILHEGSHVILAQLTGRAPSWLHEGMAQYVQTITPAGERLQISPLPAAAERIRRWLANDELITLRRYLSIPESRWRALAHDRNAVPYTVAWALVYFMMSRPAGEQALRRLLHELDKAERPPTLKRLADIYPGGISRLEYDFFKWAQGDMPPHYY